jgi:hypothetical protein
MKVLLMVDCGSAGVWDRGIKGMCNVFMGSEVYCLLYGDENYSSHHRDIIFSDISWMNC